MEVPIFPNCSYFLSLGVAKDFIPQTSRAVSAHQLRHFPCLSIEEFEQVSFLTKRITGVLIFIDKLNPRDVKKAMALASSRLVPVRLVSFEGKEMPELNSDVSAIEQSYEELSKVIDSFITAMLPKGLTETVMHASSMIFKNFFKDLSQFEVVPFINDNFDRQVTFSISAGDIVGYCSSRVRIKQLEVISPSSEVPKAELVLQEAVNQCIGVIVQSLTKIGISAKVGLPTLFDTSKIPHVQPMIFFPSTHVVDVGRKICFSIGFINLSEKPLFELSDPAGSTDSGDVEFL